MKELDVLREKLIDNGLMDDTCASAITELDGQLSLYHNLEETLFNSELHLVYMHTTPDGKKYIGITKNLPNTRWNDGSGYEAQRKFYKAIQAFGWNNIEHKIIAAGLEEKDAKKVESELILEYKTYDSKYGYNSNLSIAEVRRTENNTKNRIKQEESKEESDADVCMKLIEQYALKTVDGIIYHLEDTKYVTEKNYIEKKLIADYKITNTKRRKEIINSIKLMSEAERKEVFQETTQTKQGEEVDMLYSAFLEGGFPQVSKTDICDFITWLEKTHEPTICIPMIMDQVFHIQKKGSQTLGRRIGRALRNHGWKPIYARNMGKYGKTRCYIRNNKSDEIIDIFDEDW